MQALDSGLVITAVIICRFGVMTEKSIYSNQKSICFSECLVFRVC